MKDKKPSFFDNTVVLLSFLVGFRVVNSLLVWTYFNPDEFWQSVEVAHHMIFG